MQFQILVPNSCVRSRYTVFRCDIAHDWNPKPGSRDTVTASMTKLSNAMRILVRCSVLPLPVLEAHVPTEAFENVSAMLGWSEFLLHKTNKTV